MAIKRGQLLECSVEDMAFGGKGIARIETEKGKYVCFIPNTIPGQKVLTRVVRRKSSHAECKLLRILERAPKEVPIPYQAIPGAPYATLPIAIQQQYKIESSLDLLKKIGGISAPEKLMEDFIPSPDLWHYRNKMEYGFSAIVYDALADKEEDGFGLGFKRRGTWHCVENINRESGLFDPRIENNLKLFREHLMKSGLPAWHPPAKTGFFRYLIVRKSFAQDKFLFELVTTSQGLDNYNISDYVKAVHRCFPGMAAGILHSVNDDIGDRSRSSANASPPVLLDGADHLIEQVLDLDFKLSMTSFFQPNPQCAALLYKQCIEYVQSCTPNDANVLDLYCGTGTISQILVKHTGYTVTGVDIAEQAIKDAISNSDLNGLEKVQFLSMDANQYLKTQLETDKIPDTVVLDPPRAGIIPKALHRLIEVRPKAVVYISCNPAMLARDTAILQRAGYKLNRFRLVDQFPHTAHIEAIALFSRQ